MHDAMVTTVSKRGQTSVPSFLRRSAGLSSGKRLHWYPVSEREFRVVVESDDQAPGPLAALGWAVRGRHGASLRTDEVMRELREGEET